MTKKEILRNIAESYKVIDGKEGKLFDEMNYLLEIGEKEEARKVKSELEKQIGKRHGVLSVAMQFGYEEKDVFQETRKIEFEENIAKMQEKGIQV